jgi:hypothetical protein
MLKRPVKRNATAVQVMIVKDLKYWFHIIINPKNISIVLAVDSHMVLAPSLRRPIKPNRAMPGNIK